MSGVVAAAPRPLCVDPRTTAADGSPPTLGEWLDGVLEVVRTGATAECPICRGRMSAAGRAALCRDCGATLV
jgi:hypothetical protein